MASEIDKGNNSQLLRDDRKGKGKAVVEVDCNDQDHDDHDYLDYKLDRTALLEAQLGLSYNHHTILSQLPSTSTQPNLFPPDYFNKNRCSDINDDDVLKKVKKKLTTLCAGLDKDVIIFEWMEEIMKGLKEVREELTTMKKNIGCRPNTAA